MSETQIQSETPKKEKPEPGRGFAVRIFYPLIYGFLWLVLRFYHWPTFRGRKNLPKMKKQKLRKMMSRRMYQKHILRLLMIRISQRTEKQTHFQMK